MKKYVLITTGIALALFSSIGFYSCTKSEQASSPAKKEININNYSRSWISKILGWLGLVPSVSTSYRSGYYESTGPETFKCNPGDGICEFTITAGGMVVPDPGDTYPVDEGAAVFAYKDGNVMMIIDKETLHSTTYNNLYADGVMSIPGDWVLPEFVTSALGISAGYTIPQGDYTIETVSYENGDPDAVGDLLVVTFE
ncbi:MAG: hypothetical protein H6550_03015 [Chitinophagales bacterium]|nr:hypothetical protein [Chitinophagales bacterium]